MTQATIRQPTFKPGPDRATLALTLHTPGRRNAKLTLAAPAGTTTDGHTITPPTPFDARTTLGLLVGDLVRCDLTEATERTDTPWDLTWWDGLTADFHINKIDTRTGPVRSLRANPPLLTWT